MSHVALAVALCAVIGAALPSPGLYAAIGFGIAAIGAGWLGYLAHGQPGGRRLCGAAAMTVGALGCVLGMLRVVLVLAAIDRLDRMVDHLLG
jgi:hypothetical protein